MSEELKEGAEVPVPDEVQAPPDDFEATGDVESEEVQFEGEEPDVEVARTWWGPVSCQGGWLDATSYFIPAGLPVESALSWYDSSWNRIGGTPWYRHQGAVVGRTVGRRWRVYAGPRTRYIVAWWKGGGVYSPPSRYVIC